MKSPTKTQLLFRTQLRTRTMRFSHGPLVLGLFLTQFALAQDPVITQQPSGRSVIVGGNASFSVRATSNNGTMTFQWQRDDPTLPVTFTNIPNAVRGTFSIAGVVFEDAGDYRVIVANAGGDSVTSDVAHLEVVAPPFTKLTDGPVVTNRANFFTGTWADMDNDGFSDLLVMAGPDVANQAPVLYRNVGGTDFVELTTDQAGEIIAPNGGWFYQGLWADFDNDGFLDLLEIGDQLVESKYVATNRFFRGQADHSLQLVTIDNGINRLPGSAWQNSLADYDNDGFLDVYFTTGWSSANPQTRDMLYRNNGDGTFTHAWSPTGKIFDTQFGCWADYDNDGDADVWVTGMGNYGELYRNEGDGTFALLPTSPTIPMIRHFFGCWGDYDNDGYLDLINSSTLFHSDQNGGFSIATQTFTSGGLQVWGDYDNDGNLDFVCGRFNQQPPVFYRNRGDGTFAETNLGSPSADTPSNESIPTWCDYNNDGFLDLHISTRANPSGPNYLYRNNGVAAGLTNRWLIVKLVGTASNRSAIGAKVRVLATIRGSATWQLRVISGVYFDDLRAHFGLGDAEVIDTLRIEWPSGIVQELRDVTPNQILTVTEPARLIPQEAGRFQIKCWINQSFDVQCSSDLETWMPVTTVTNEKGTLIFEDVEADQHDCRYYRVVEARPNMVWIPAGTFLMGSPEDEIDRQEDEGPQTQVTLTKGFWIGKYEVTQGEYLEVTGTNPSDFNGAPFEGAPDYGTDLTRPVENVSWEDAVAYCGALTERERAAGQISAKYVYRLPTEAEWEYACRAWTSTRFSYGDDPGYASLTNYAWYYDNCDDQTHPVGQKLPNPWGLHDMYGNVAEWCQDWWAESLPGGTVLDPQGPTTGYTKVFRGGGWRGWHDWSFAFGCRSAFRDRRSGVGNPGHGFRVVLAPAQP